MIKVLLVGCNGKMGRTVAALCRTSSSLQIAAGIDVFGGKQDTFPVFERIGDYPDRPDVIIDFSRPAGLMSNLEFAVSFNVPLVIATTGLSQEQNALIARAAASVPVFKSANMSLGVAVLRELSRKCAAVLGERYDIEIIERHHRQKVDAPSGTALMLADAIAECLPYKPEYVYDRHSFQAARAPGEIGISSIRGGTIVGDHEVLFAGTEETISLHHNAQSRDVFAAGAMRAAEFIVSQPAGLYGMQQLVENALKNI